MHPYIVVLAQGVQRAEQLLGFQLDNAVEADGL
jgi:hypothetical protein